MKVKTVFSLLFVIAIVSTASADRRNYVWTYQYITMPKGATEIELYQTTKLKDVDEWEYRFEIEHGLTNRWDFSVYQIFKQNEDTQLSWDAVQYRMRYRLGEEGYWLMDPLLYLEYNRKLDSKEPNKLEAKIILAKTISKFNLSINPVYEFFFAPDTKHELGLDVGFSFEFNPKLTLGLESTSRFEFEDDEIEVGSYLGPTISFASGKWWYTIGGGIGLTDKSDDGRIRFLMGVGL